MEYGIISVPETFVFDRSGELVRKVMGPIDPEELSQLLQDLL